MDGNLIMESINPADPRCPECGEPIGMTSAFCMHCSADLTESSKQADVHDVEDRTDMNESSTLQASASAEDSATTNSITSDESPLDPDRLLHKSLAVVVGLIGGFVIGFLVMIFITVMASVVLGIATGFLVWLGTTIYFAMRRTVQEAISKAAYGIAIALMLYSLIPFSSTWEANSLNTRLTDFVVLLVITAFLAAIIGGIGYLAGRFVPEDDIE